MQQSREWPNTNSQHPLECAQPRRTPSAASRSADIPVHPGGTPAGPEPDQGASANEVSGHRVHSKRTRECTSRGFWDLEADATGAKLPSGFVPGARKTPQQLACVRGRDRGREPVSSVAVTWVAKIRLSLEWSTERTKKSGRQTIRCRPPDGRSHSGLRNIIH